MATPATQPIHGVRSARTKAHKNTAMHSKRMPLILVNASVLVTDSVTKAKAMDTGHTAEVSVRPTVRVSTASAATIAAALATMNSPRASEKSMCASGASSSVAPGVYRYSGSTWL